jgi:hypothetical protein
MANLATILPPLLYRYRRIDTDAHLEREIDAIKQGALWFTDYRNMNDAMEGFFSPTSRFKRQTDYTRVAARMRDAKLALGLCCFSGSRDNEIMWAHYASNYRGICVAYRTQPLLDGLPKDVDLVRLSYGNPFAMHHLLNVSNFECDTSYVPTYF